MNNSNNGFAFVQGMVLGALVGVTAGILLAPKSGAETRADIAAAAKRMQEKAQSAYDDARAALERKVEALKKAGEKIDKSKYTKLVDEVVAEMTNTKEVTQGQGEELGKQLKADSDEILAALKA